MPIEPNEPVARTSITDHDGYLGGVLSALNDEAAFAAFKQDFHIKGAVERLRPARGAEYREIVLRQSPGLLAHLDKFRENDRLGSPDVAPYPEGPMSPTTWRYIKVLSDLQMLFGSLDGWHIAEIGVGYGGQCKILHDLYKIASYRMFDLEPVMRLAEKYLSRVAPAANEHLTLGDFRRLGDGPPETYDLVISNWALSECTKPIQDAYVSHVLQRSKRGYITYNQISELVGVESYKKAEFIDRLGFPVTLMEEGLQVDVPEHLENFILHWSSQPFLP